MKVTTSANKLAYGHYLQQKGKDIDRCVSRDKIKDDCPEFYEQLVARETKLKFKRK